MVILMSDRRNEIAILLPRSNIPFYCQIAGSSSMQHQLIEAAQGSGGAALSIYGGFVRVRAVMIKGGGGGVSRPQTPKHKDLTGLKALAMTNKTCCRPLLDVKHRIAKARTLAPLTTAPKNHKPQTPKRLGPKP